MNNDGGTVGYVFRVIGETVVLGIVLMFTMAFLDSIGLVEIGCLLVLLLFLAWPIWRWLQWARRAKGQETTHQYLALDIPSHLQTDVVRIDRVSGTLKKKKASAETPGVGDETIYRFGGAGTRATEVIDLEEGLYHIRYNCRGLGTLNVSLIHRLSGNATPILNQVVGSGSQTFFVEESDRYVFQIETILDGTPAWKIECERA
jgi:hypothetical protein